ncbi:MAG: hypothetical protein ACREP9_06760 [Candidatus Dormibacteraceae bacterium]
MTLCEGYQSTSGFLGFLLSVDSPASSTRTGELRGWEPTHPGLLEDLGDDHYYANAPS